MTTTETTDSTETAPELGTLAADDVRALATAESVCFHRYGGEHYIRPQVGSSIDGSTIFTAAQQRVFNDTKNTGSGERSRKIATGGSVYAYSYPGSPGWAEANAPHVTCFESISSAQFSPTWTTVAGLLRTGDVLHLEWVADNHSYLAENHGLHSDELRLIVKRGKRRLTFALAFRVGPDNSARMIRRHGR